MMFGTTLYMRRLPYPIHSLHSGSTVIGLKTQDFMWPAFEPGSIV